MKKYFYSLALVLLMSVFIASPVFATATLHMGFGAGTACATGCGGHPNLSPEGGSDTISIYKNGGGGDIDSPVWLIIGVPDENDPNFFSTSDIMDVGLYEDYGTPGEAYTDLGNSAGTYLGLADGALLDGTLTPGNGELAFGEELYDDVLGMPSPGYNLNNSNNFGNWYNAELDATGIDADFFGIYVFYIDSALGGGDLLDITFTDGTLPLGTYTLAYGYDVDGKPSFYGTPFTESGLQVPEPSTLLLLGSGLIGLGIIRKRFGRVA